MPRGERPQPAPFGAGSNFGLAMGLDWSAPSAPALIDGDGRLPDER